MQAVGRKLRGRRDLSENWDIFRNDAIPEQIKSGFFSYSNVVSAAAFFSRTILLMNWVQIRTNNGKNWINNFLSRYIAVRW